MKLLLIITLLLAFLAAKTQGETDPYIDDEVIVDTATVFYDEYIKYTPALGGDSIRLHMGRPINGMHKDFHPNGQVKHKGYYSMGILSSSYTNFFQDGATEREFILKSNGDIESNLYYTNGKPRYHTLWKKGVIVEYTEYWSNGIPSNVEVFEKDGVRYTKYERFFNDSTMKYSLVPINLKKGMYYEKVFFANGKVAEEGNIIFSPAMAEYRRVDDWKIYSNEGVLIRVDQYSNGVMVKEGSTVE